MVTVAQAPGPLDGLDVVNAVVAVVLLATVVVRRDLVRPGSTDHWLWSALACLAISHPLLVTPVYELVESVVGVPGAASSIRYAFGAAAAVSVRLFVVRIAGARSRRPVPRVSRTTDLALGGLAVSGITLPFIMSPPAAEHPSLAGLPLYYDSTWRSAVFWGCFLAILTWALASALVFCLRYADLAGPGLLRARLRFIAAGLAVGLLYVAVKAAVVTAWMVGSGPATVEFSRAADAALLGVALALIVVGTTADALTSHIRSVVSVTHLRPLWRDIAAACPHVIRVRLDPSRRMRLVPTGSYVVELVDRVVEIRDGLLDLRGYMPPTLVAEMAHVMEEGRVPPSIRPVVIEAVTVEMGRRRKGAGACPDRRGPAVSELVTVWTPGSAIADVSSRQPGDLDGGRGLNEATVGQAPDVATDARFLVRVADARRRCPLVSALMDSAAPSDGRPHPPPHTTRTDALVTAAGACSAAHRRGSPGPGPCPATPATVRESP